MTCKRNYEIVFFLTANRKRYTYNTHAPIMDLGWSISPSLNYFLLLEHSILWLPIYYDHLHEICQITKTWLSWKNCYLKPTLAFPTGRVFSKNLAIVFLGNWLLPYDSPNYVLANYGHQFVRQLFTTFHLFLAVKGLTITAYHLQKNCLVQRFNSTLASRMLHYDSEH